MITRKLRWLSLTLLLTCGLLTAGCELPTTPDPNGGETGTLRVLVTDHPFPFDLIEEATLTITRVEVRRVAALTCETECDDGVFCNGLEICVNGSCVAGTPPCAVEQVCDEENATCITPCDVDADCDDGVDCNGLEVCAEGECAVGPAVCDEGEVCDEVNDVCVTPADEEEPDDEDNGNGEGPFVVIFEGAKEFNLLDLQNGRTDLLADAEIAAGTYDQMRLIVTEGTVVLKDGAGSFNLRVPSGAQTGIKLHFTFEVEADEETILLLDVDLSRLFIPVPGGRISDPSTIRTFLFRPSVAMRLIQWLDAGSIAGVVQGAIEGGDPVPVVGASVAAFQGAVQFTSTATAEDGSYVLSGLPTGTYRVEVSAIGFNDTSIDGVEVIGGVQSGGVDFVLNPEP